MCELLVYARIDGHEDHLHPMRYRPGDVVVARNDGCVWGTEELKPNSSFRVVVFPGVPVGAVDHLLEGWAALGEHKRRRRYKLDIEHTSLRPVANFWIDHSHSGRKVVVGLPVGAVTVDKVAV